MARKLIARLGDGSEHVVKMHAGDPEEALKRLTGTEHRGLWVDIEEGRVRYESVVAFYIREEDDDRAINELLRELQARGGGTLEDVTRELERRGIEVPQRTGHPSD